ncbi:VOC family protein [Bacillus gobiensis]|uniref:VOC family protein n=1 Tax=Bacillus gobiensis TaxID=1441095 RepID=UPI003D1A0B3C
MNISFDHIIHYVEHPKKTSEFLAKLGIHSVEGGKHETRGTNNYLSHFGLSYIELLGIFDRQLFRENEAAQVTFSPFSTIEKDGFKEGFARIALRTNNLHQLAESLQNQGLSTNGPVPLSRRRPDGTLIEWELLYAHDEGSDLPLPFFIDWGSSDEDRYKELSEQGIVQSTQEKKLPFTKVVFSVRDLTKSVENWKRWFSLESGPVFIDDTLQAKCQTLYLPGTNLVFAAENGDGIVSSVLDERGERPFLVCLTNENSGYNQSISGGVYQLPSSFNLLK